MAQPLVGAGAFLGAGEETTYGTAVTVTHWLRAAALALKRDVKRQTRGDLGTYGDSFSNAADTFVEGDEAGGQVSLPLGYDGGFGLLLKHCFGADSTSGTGPYVHEFTLTNNGPATEPALTLEQNLGQNGPSARSEKFAGCKVASWEFDWSVGREAMLTMDVIGRTSAGATTSSTPTFADVSGSFHQHFSDFTFNSASVPGLTACKVKCDRAMARRMALGSSYTGEPYQDGEGSVMVEIKYRVTDNALYTAYLAGTKAAGQITVGDGTNSLVFDFGSMQLEKVERSVASRGAIEATATFRCLRTATNLGVKATLTNTETTPEAVA